MKKLLFVCLLGLGNVLHAQRNTSFEVLEDNLEFTRIRVQVGDPQFQTVNTPAGEAYRIRLDKGVSVHMAGAPDLPSLAFSIMVPNNHTATLEVEQEQFSERTQILVAPSKGKILRNQNPASIPYRFGNEYSSNSLYPAAVARIQNQHTLRDVQGATVKLYPLQYNPVTRVLKQYTSLVVRVKYSLPQGMASSPLPQTVDESFHQMYRHHFLNYASKKTRYSPIKQVGPMLIVTPGAFLNTLEPFIQWKKRTGMPVFVCNADTLAGGVNETTLKGIAKWYYQNKQIAYLLLVGDHQQIPAINSPIPAVTTLFGACCDWPSSYINNNDHYPEFIVGRFSAQTVGELQTQLIKSIQYERNPDVSTNWMNKQIGVASKEGDVDSDDSQLDFEHICNILDSNKNQFTYVNNQGYFDGDQTSCNDAAGYPTPTDIQMEFNNGIGLMNYCGHGSVQAITSSGFSNTQANGITNTQAHPIVFSTACYNGTFMNGTCLAEALMQAKAPNGNPTGSVATLMCSILQAWNPPMEGQDEINAIIRGVRSNNIRSTYGAIVASGNMALMDKYNDFADPDGGNEVADTWVLFGDPSLEIRTNQEGLITCQHSGWLQKGNTIFHVNCPVEGARVSFVYQNEVIASSLVQGGLATLYFAPVNNLDSISVTVTKQNWVPYLGKIDVVDFPLTTSNTTPNGLVIYPNPVTETLFVQVDNQQNIEKLEILDISGRIITTQENFKVGSGLSVSSLTPGSYMLRVSSTEGIRLHRFTKQ